MSKIQILKAIHNTYFSRLAPKLAVYDVKDTNFESNSQQNGNAVFLRRLFMMSKIQILKAIHNMKKKPYKKAKAVYDVKDTNFESNSQQPTEGQK